MKYIDIHGHINFAAYDLDRNEVIDRANKANVKMFAVGSDLSSSKKAVQLAHDNTNVFAVIGFHPVYAGESHNDELETGKSGDESRPKQEFEYEQFLKLAADPKVVAIGECGLDYFHSSQNDIGVQREIFIKHIDIANQVNKPLMLHVRNGKNTGSAYHDAVSILKEHAKVPANFHFFAGSLDDLKEIVEIGASVSFTGVITFARSYDEVIKAVPIDRIMAETDCPYVAPHPFRGQRSEPAHVVLTVKKIAEIRGQNELEIADQIYRNSQNFFAIKVAP